MSEETKAVEVVDTKTGEIQEISSSPEELLVAASEAARALERVIALNDRPPLMFNGKRYLEFHHWQVFGKFYHVTVKTMEPEFVELGGVQGFRAKAEAIDERTGIVVGGAEAFCMRDEVNWKSKPTFQLASMAQTRAASKALSNKFRFVAIVAGYEGTPSEEMVGEPGQKQVAMPKALAGKALPLPPPEGTLFEDHDAKVHAAISAQAPVSGEAIAAAVRPPESKFYAQLKKSVRERGILDEKMKASIKALFGKDSSKDLTDKEMVGLIKIVETGGIK